jgi:hypothetical protein
MQCEFFGLRVDDGGAGPHVMPTIFAVDSFQRPSWFEPADAGSNHEAFHSKGRWYQFIIASRSCAS